MNGLVKGSESCFGDSRCVPGEICSYRRRLSYSTTMAAQTMNIWSWAIPAVVLALGAMVQSAAGFGFSLMAVPLLMATGY